MIDIKAILHDLKMLITRSNDRIILIQIVYLQTELKHFKITDSKTSSIFMNENLINIITSFDDKYRADTDTVYWYASIVNSFIYVMTMTRSDSNFAFFVLFRCCSNSDSTHVKAATQLFCYGKETLHYNIYYEGKEGLMNYIDGDWIKVIDDKRSTEEYIYVLFENSILWSFKRQDRIIQSFCKAEYVTSAEANKKAVWLRSLLIQLHAYFVKTSVKLLANNQKVITLIKNSKYYQCTKHIDVKYHWIREVVKNEIIEFKYILNEDMTENSLTKLLRAIKFNKFQKILKMLEEIN